MNQIYDINLDQILYLNIVIQRLRRVLGFRLFPRYFVRVASTHPTPFLREDPIMEKFEARDVMEIIYVYPCFIMKDSSVA